MRRLVVAVALLLLVASRASAASITLLFTVNHYTAAAGLPQDISFNASFFSSATNLYPGGFPPASLASINQNGLGPGVFTYLVSFDVPSLDQVYFTGHGGYLSGPGFHTQSVFVAEPPSGPVPDVQAFGYGPPWISLADLAGGQSLTGDLHTFLGYDNYPHGSVGSWTVQTAVPEPASVLLLGGGLAALIARRVRSRSHM